MKTFLIAVRFNQLYPQPLPLNAIIRDLFATQRRISLSAWLVKSNESATAIQDALVGHTNDADDLIIIELDEPVWTALATEATNNWLKRHLK